MKDECQAFEPEINRRLTALGGEREKIYACKKPVWGQRMEYDGEAEVMVEVFEKEVSSQVDTAASSVWTDDVRFWENGGVINLTRGGTFTVDRRDLHMIERVLSYSR